MHLRLALLLPLSLPVSISALHTALTMSANPSSSPLPADPSGRKEAHDLEDYDDDAFNDAVFDSDPDAPPRLSKNLQRKGKKKASKSRKSTDAPRRPRFFWQPGPLLRFVCQHFDGYRKDPTIEYAKTVANRAWSLFPWPESYNIADVQRVRNLCGS